MKLTTLYVQTLGSQLQAMTSFAQVTDLVALQQAWPKTQKVLELNDIDIPRSDALPSYDVDLPSFQRSIVSSVRPNLSTAVVTLLTEPAPQGIALVKQTPVEQIEALNDLEVLTEEAGRMMTLSAALYLKLGIQLETAASYFMSKETVSGELLWQMRMLFAVNELSTNVLNMEQASTPHTAYAFSAALMAMIKPKLEARLALLLNDEDAKNLLNDHAITTGGNDRAYQASLITSTTKERVTKLLRPNWADRLGKIFGR